MLGYLKITVYSDYLHIYDKNHVIGLGKETAGGNEDFSWYQGLKISLFDVSDVANPAEEAKIEIGDRGTNSEALYEPHAFLFDKSKNLLVIPVSLAEINKSQYSGEIPDNAYGETIWQGAYIFNIKEGEIRVRGKITHSKDNVWSNPIQRSLYIRAVMYTISKGKIKANELEIVEEIS